MSASFTRASVASNASMASLVMAYFEAKDRALIGWISAAVAKANVIFMVCYVLLLQLLIRLLISLLAIFKKIFSSSQWIG